MEVFTEYLATIENPQHRARTESVLRWVVDKYPALKPKIAWNQPVFTDHGTFIIGFSVSKKHLAVAPERVAINKFSDQIVQAGYEHSKELIRIPWDSLVDFLLLERIIDFNILDKASYKAFWRKTTRP